MFEPTKPIMTPENSYAVRYAEKLKPFLEKLGYTIIRKFTRNGLPSCVEFYAPDQSLLGEGADLNWCNKMTLYENDSYPNERGEIFLNTWNSIGNDYKANRIAEVLTKAGLPTRATSHKKYRGIRVKVENYNEG